VRDFLFTVICCAGILSVACAYFVILSIMEGRDQYFAETVGIGVIALFVTFLAWTAYRALPKKPTDIM
jgi:hypothetical protein